jgi:hypothetical protein
MSNYDEAVAQAILDGTMGLQFPITRLRSEAKSDVRAARVLAVLEEAERAGLIWVDEADGRWRLTEKGMAEGMAEVELYRAKRELRRTKRKGAKVN